MPFPKPSQLCILLEGRERSNDVRSTAHRHTAKRQGASCAERVLEAQRKPSGWPLLGSLQAFQGSVFGLSSNSDRRASAWPRNRHLRNISVRMLVAICSGRPFMLSNPCWGYQAPFLQSRKVKQANHNDGFAMVCQDWLIC